MSINPESRLKKLAKDSGYTVAKSGAGYVLSHTLTGKIIAGEKLPLTLQSLAVELQKLHILGR